MSLPFHTTTQFVALGLTLLAGWLFGLATAPRYRRWRDRFREEETAHAATRERYKAELADADRRIRELETELARERSGTAIAAPSAASIAADAAPDTGWRGWFGWGRDNLSRIRGVDAPIEARLNDLGVKTYREIETMTADDEIALERRLGFADGTIADQGWREQAALLRAGNEDEHGRRFG